MIKLPAYIRDNYPHQDTINIKEFKKVVVIDEFYAFDLNINENKRADISFDVYHHNIKFGECFIETQVVAFESSYEIKNFKEVSFFPNKLKTIKIKGTTLYFEGDFNIHKNVKFQPHGNGFAKYGDVLEESAFLKCKLAFSFFTVDDMKYQVPIKAIEILNDLEKSRYELFLLLCQEVKETHLKKISEVDYGYGEAEVFSVLNKVLKTRKFPKTIEFQTGENLSLTCWTKVGGKDENISTMFSLLFLLTGDYQHSIAEAPHQYWLIHLFVITNTFDKKYKQALLKYYLWYLQNKFTYENPGIILLYLIVGTMIMLDYPESQIEKLLYYLEKTEYSNISFLYTFFPQKYFGYTKKAFELVAESHGLDKKIQKRFLNIWHQIESEYKLENGSK